MSALTILGLILFAFAVLFELCAALTGRWSTGYNWVLAVIGGFILAVQLRRRDRKIGRWIDIVLLVLFVILLVLRFTR